jgi:hypothetical protein
LWPNWRHYSGERKENQEKFHTGQEVSRPDANTGPPSHEAQSSPPRVDWHTKTKQTYCQNAFITNSFIEDSILLSQK